VEDAFAQMKKGNKENNSLIKPKFNTERIARKKEIEQAHLCLGYEGFPLHDEEIFSLVLLNNALGGSMSSRLFQEVREKRGLAYSVFSYHSSFHDTGMLTIYAGTAQKHLDELFDVLLN
ncbi:pitrilysin family protein, partial [Pseudomonas sp. 2822-17]|uniref:M16 family metallopeptidase n=1 Tax=Pseudomonas sp. 2822-17 TaxID=1712678 RepID=UPI00117A832B